MQVRTLRPINEYEANDDEYEYFFLFNVHNLPNTFDINIFIHPFISFVRILKFIFDL